MASTPAGKKPASPKKSTKPAVPPKDAGFSAREADLFVAPDQAVIAERRQELLSTRDVPHGTEKDLVRTFKEMSETGLLEDRIPLTDADTLVLEQAFRYGRADIVVYHQDGSVSVIEAKNGSVGYSHVMSGIGQATLYAVQIATKGAAKRVRRCLLWSSTGDLALDTLIDLGCDMAGVVSLSMPSMRVVMANREAARQVIQEMGNGCAQSD